jgi:cysteinyl-tRNA synthetase
MVGSIVPLTVALTFPGALAHEVAAQEGPLQQVRTWVYQLDRIDPRTIAASGFDLAVVDYSADGSAESEFSPNTLDMMKRKPDGSRRIVLAYMSIGEAEDYRFYWRENWSLRPPSWLDSENPDWPGNYKVRYWDPTWQSLIFGSPDAYLDRILDAGFDGVYLDIIDAFEFYEGRRPTAEGEMVELVCRIADYGRARSPGRSFYVIPQNGERLLAHPEYLETVDGIAKEDLFWGYDGIEGPTPQDERDFSVEFLARATRANKLVLTVDYPVFSDLVGEFYYSARDLGFVPYSTSRDLDRITVNPGHDPVGSAQSRGQGDRRLPGQFFALTAPKGAIRANLTADYWSENLRYSAADLGSGDGEDETAFTARSFDERTVSLTIGYGLSDRWEIGVGLPVIDGHFERSPEDGLPGLEPSVDDTGLGNIRLFLATSTSWDEGNKNVLSVLEVALPTDSRSAPFGGGNGEVRFSITAERYWNRLGVIGSAGATVYLDEELGSSETVGEFSIGLGIQAAESLFGSLLVTREGDALRPEFAVEALLGSNFSLEVFAGGDLTGAAEATSVGLALNLWFLGAGG